MGTRDRSLEQRPAGTPRTALLDTEAVAEALGVTPRHVRRLIAERRIPFVKVGRFVRFDPGALDMWVDQQTVEVKRGHRLPAQPADSLARRRVARSSLKMWTPSAFASQLERFLSEGTEQ